jgi:hypothetical protein
VKPHPTCLFLTWERSVLSVRLEIDIIIYIYITSIVIIVFFHYDGSLIIRLVCMCMYAIFIVVGSRSTCI